MSVHSTPDLIADLRNVAERLETFSKGVTAIVHLWDEFPEDVGDQVWVDCIEGLRGLVDAPATDDRDPPEFPDVDPETGDERETTGLDEHGDPE